MNEKANRAKQFLPFASLKGYYEEIRKRQRVIQAQREPSEEELLRLSALMAQVKKGMMIKVTHYVLDAYETTEGLVTQIDPIHQTLTLVKTRIDMKNILDLQGEGLIDPSDL